LCIVQAYSLQLLLPLFWDWLSMVLRLRQHNIGYTADGFCKSDDPTNSVEASKEVVSHPDRPQSNHDAHLTVLQYYHYFGKRHIRNSVCNLKTKSTVQASQKGLYISDHRLLEYQPMANYPLCKCVVIKTDRWTWNRSAPVPWPCEFRTPKTRQRVTATLHGTATINVPIITRKHSLSIQKKRRCKYCCHGVGLLKVCYNIIVM